MSSLKVSQIKRRLVELFESHIDLADVSAADADREPKILSRCVAALAIYAETGCSVEEAGASVWDGGGDNGIDAAFFDAAESRVVFVQSKWISKGAGEPSAADIGTFVQGVRDAIETNFADFAPRLHDKLNEICLRLGSPGTSVLLLVASTGASVLASPGASRLAKFVSELNGVDPNPIASSKVMGLAETYDALSGGASGSKPTVDAQILEWSQFSTPYLAYTGVIDGLQLKNWWDAHGRRILAENIRHALGATEVNAAIRASAVNRPELFWYLNNGITLIADGVEKAPKSAASRSAGVFRFHGASIVNGAQTVSSLARVADEVALGVVRVPIRVIVLDGAPSQFGFEVTRANNLQNRIEPRDFVAQDPEQSRLRSEMAIEGVDYQFVRNEDAHLPANGCELIEATTALACASGDPSLAVQVKTGISRFFLDLQKPPYRTIFNPALSGARLYNATIFLRDIDKWIEAKKKSLVKKSGPTWGVLVHGNRVLAAATFSRLPNNVLDKPIADFSALKGSIALDSLLSVLLEQMVEVIQKEYPSNFLAVLFKNPSMSKAVYAKSISGIKKLGIESK
jgi:hypothetical protein